MTCVYTECVIDDAIGDAAAAGKLLDVDLGKGQLSLDTDCNNIMTIAAAGCNISYHHSTMELTLTFAKLIKISID